MKSFISMRRDERVAVVRVAPARIVFAVAVAVLCFAGMRSVSRAQASGTMPNGAVTVQTSGADDPVRQLTSRDASVRKRAAEELARMADTERRRIVEGYRLQEKDGRVRVALDWALYRMGKNEALYNVVRALESSRWSDQASVYLSELESPAPLYVFLERANGQTQIKLLQVLAYSGDADTLERIKPFAASLDPLVAQAAKNAADDISKRLAETPSSTPAPARPRRSGSEEDESEPEDTSP